MMLEKEPAMILKKIWENLTSKMKIRSETVSAIVKGVPTTPTFINCKKYFY